MTLCDEKYDTAIKLWLTDQPNMRQRITRGVVAIFHTKSRQPIRFWGVIHLGSKAVMASSAPAVAWFLYDTITGWMAAAASGTFFIGHFFTEFFNEMSKKKRQDGNLVSEIATRFGEIMQSFPYVDHGNAQRDDNIRSGLGILEAVARDITKAEKGEISVCLATYEDPQHLRMRIRHRNPGSTRPSNKCFEAQSTIAHQACQSGPYPRVVHDLRLFGPKGCRSPTQSEVTYRSIFIIPVESDRNGKKQVCGFISIDSTKPFAFYGNKQNSIIVVCEPVISHIEDLLQGGES